MLKSKKVNNQILDELRDGNFNELVYTVERELCYEMRFDLDFPLLKKYHNCIKSIVKDNGLQQKFWSTYDNDIKTWDRVYNLNKLKFIEILDSCSFDTIKKYWQEILKNPEYIIKTAKDELIETRK